MKRSKAAIFIRLLIIRCNYRICLKCLGLFERFEIAPLNYVCFWLIKIKCLFFLLMRRNMYESIQARVDAIISFILFLYKNKLRGISRL